MERSPEEERLGVQWKATRPQKNRPRCFCTGCDARSAKNHLLMQNGLISEISGSNRHVRELRTNRFRSVSNYYSFERIGYDDALTMYGYCARCDHKLFAQIEVPAPKIPVDSPAVARYALRPILHEIRKKQGNLKYLATLPPQKLPHWLSQDLTFALAVERRGIAFLTGVYEYVVRAISNKVVLDFVVRRSARIDLCASAILIRPLFAADVTDPSMPNLPPAESSLSVNVLNIFPFGDSLITVSATMPLDREGVKLNRSTANLSDEGFSALLSHILVSQIEDWAISEAAYERLPVGIEATISNAKCNPSLFHIDAGVRLF